MRIKTNTTDKLFSIYVRTRDNWTCQRCSTKYIPPTNGLQCAHNFGRRVHATRWHEHNAMALCTGCHTYLDEHEKKRHALFIEKFGEREFKTVRALHDIPKGRVDQVAKRLELREKIAELEK